MLVDQGKLARILADQGKLARIKADQGKIAKVLAYQGFFPKQLENRTVYARYYVIVLMFWCFLAYSDFQGFEVTVTLEV